ncbi:MAG TPA: hypothetical protein PKY53_00390 [Clostridia bacterium]|jgi:hypothetical protein|nr:hypothetical protein [Clostridia bacterium]
MDYIKVVQKLNKNGYFLCSMYYLKRFVGVREIVLVSLLSILAVWLYVAYEIFIALIFLGVTIALILLAVVLFLVTGIWGYKHDFEKTDIEYHQLEFYPDRFIAASLNKVGEPVHGEEHSYDKIEAIALRKDRIYIYAGVALFYYVTAQSMKENTLDELKGFLQEYVKPEKFRLKRTIRKYPKKDKIKLG